MLTLIVRKTIRATPERLFAAWTEPKQLMQWWGPRGVQCIDAQVDLRVGGALRLANQFPDGRVLYIAGEFEVIEPPRRLVYSWRLEGVPNEIERVTVRFEPRPEGTEVIVQHERIETPDILARHESGWRDCLDGLDNYSSLVH